MVDRSCVLIRTTGFGKLSFGSSMVVMVVWRLKSVTSVMVGFTVRVNFFAMVQKIRA
jgi:hypothetical protein